MHFRRTPSKADDVRRKIDLSVVLRHVSDAKTGITNRIEYFQGDVLVMNGASVQTNYQ